MTLRQAVGTAARTPYGLYGAAVVRIGVSGLFLLNLLREAGHADRLWGPGSPYTPELFRASVEARGADDRLSWWYTWLGTQSPDLFWAAYVLAVAVSALYLLGWHTRIMAVLFACVVAGFYMRSSVANSGFELLSLLFANYLVLCASGRRWSLDARRAARPAPVPVGPREELRRRVVTVLHNTGLALLAFQVMVVYGTAALYKIRGTSWRDGTALHYALRLDDFATFPGLSDWLAGHGDWLAVLAYVTVSTQLLFPALVFSPRLKYALLVVMLGTHLTIGLLMALPMFSAITIVGDLVFLPTAFWVGASTAVTAFRTSGPCRWCCRGPW
ncbi:HTTM domain-containing protein [Streptomyces sp. Je 1-369]|uniref:HTTM domain-containing protein n=1 Tax=Streptomyces sp. Je 1-369 TaxID=2966192 RepID=UPI002286BD4D|nr:HTTM domain-containing protein [Streptomyces sp. Je 1-369]WAL99670.1 HTTM domain-containing protein [Streptomyces sp. Je 1-369]